MSAGLQPARATPGRRRTVTIAAVVVAAGALAAGSIVAGRSSGGDNGGPPAAARLTTVAIVRTDLTSTTQVTGTLGFAGSRTIIGRTSGSLFTWLPSPGVVVRR